MKSELTFCGGAGSVTGANFLLDTGSMKVLIDCGSEAQERVCDDVNFSPFPYQPADIGVLIVTHSHADHIGRIPRLVREGFKGRIISTAATKEISEIMFDDAIKIMREETVRHGCDMLYETEHAAQAIAQWETHEYHEPFTLGDFTVEFLDAGHVLGSALVKLTREDRAIVFSGDLGNSPEPLLKNTESAHGVQYIVMESVYGDRVHEGRENRTEQLREAIEAARSRKGTLIIPSFSVERTQVLLFEIHDLIANGRMAPIPVYLDAPLATRITEVFKKHAGLFNEAAQKRLKDQGDLFSFSGLSIIHNTGESKAIHKEADPKIIIAGAGMSGGGRVRAHEREYLPDEKAGVLFVGYQAPGTLGRRIEDGAKHVQIDGEDVRVRAHIGKLTGYSGHADRDQLMQFVENAAKSVEKVFVTMGEPKASLFLAQRMKDFFGINTAVPKMGDKEVLEW